MKIFLLRSFFFLLTIHYIITGTSYDSYFGLYKDSVFDPHQVADIANSTWKEFFISENMTSLVKSIPSYIDNDKELDLFVLDSGTRLYWVSNIRGTSKEAKHHMISQSRLIDFLVSKQINSNHLEEDARNFYIIGISSKRDKLFKYKMNPHAIAGSVGNTTNPNQKTWDETELLNINDQESIISEFTKNSFIKSIHMYEISSERQWLLVCVENYDNHSTNLLKIIIQNEAIDNIDVMKFESSLQIIGAYDMNKDGLIDILYVDNKNNLYILLNDDPYYIKLLVSQINTVQLRASQSPRVFIMDSDRDGYPDIITADLNQNTIGIFFNHGKEYWRDVKQFYMKNKKDVPYNKNIWSFVPLIDIYEENINERTIRDFTVFGIKSTKRINFEILAIYGNRVYWFVEKDLGIPEKNNWGSHYMIQNYYYCMAKGDVVIETQGNDDKIDYSMILDIDVNSDFYPEFILYSKQDSSLYWIKKYEPYITGFGWKPDFWVYLIIYTYIISSIIGILEFLRLKKLKDELALQQLLGSSKEKGNLEMNIYSLKDEKI